MEKAQPAMTVEKFIDSWNSEFPDFPLASTDLTKPPVVMSALLQVFRRLGIDTDAVLAPPSENERDEHTIYYWDLIPVINVTRVIHHFVAVMPQLHGVHFTITHCLQPTTTNSFSILYLLVNLVMFNEDRLRNIAPYEEELFSKLDVVKALEEEKNKLVEMLNVQASEKGERAERLQRIDQDIAQCEDELKAEKEAHDEEKQELEAILEENKHLEVSVEQKKAHRDALVTEVVRKRALRVYDAEDVKAQVEQATQNVQEVEEKLESLRATLIQKENSLQNLQTIKPNLDAANNYLHEIMKLSQSLKELDATDVDGEGPDGELDVMLAELRNVNAQLAETKAAREELAAARVDAEEKRRRERADLMTALEEAQQQDKKSSDEVQKALARIDEIKELTLKYEEERCERLEKIRGIREDFSKQIKQFEDVLLEKLLAAEKDMETKIKKSIE